ncbi:MAG: hypothetical protein JXR48_02680 [Candidatus Delongbacteria bacterium]|nr:hypothetical protein [Candidatus Delongbacteria bacterium]MBN2833852.1 hypothetical protein [Candidatus Delongbacteria bacterium]
MDSDLSNESLEGVVLSYLEKANNISNLEIESLYTENGNNGEIIHFVGKERGSSKRYYRTYHVDKFWTPWEDINIDINGDNLSIAVVNKNPILIWMDYTKKEITTKVQGYSYEKSIRSIDFYFSINDSRTWKPKKRFENIADVVERSKKLTTNPVETIYDLSDITLKISKSQDDSSFVAHLAYKIDDDRYEVKSFSVNPFFSTYNLLEKKEYGSLNEFFGIYPNELSYKFYKNKCELNIENMHDLQIIIESGYNKLIKLNSKTFITQPSESVSINPMSNFTVQDEDNSILFERQKTDEQVYLAKYLYHPYLPDIYGFAMNNRSNYNFLRYLQNIRCDSFYKQYLKSTSNTVNSKADDALDPGNFINFVENEVYFYYDIFQDGYFFPLKINVDVSEKYHYYGILIEFENPSSTCCTITPSYNSAYSLQVRPKEVFTYNIEDINLQEGENVIKIFLRDQNNVRKFELDSCTLHYRKNQSNDIICSPYPVQEISFDITESYSTYNWEIFYHIPMIIAQNLTMNGKYEEAMNWFHYIFDPKDKKTNPWKLKPFRRYSGISNVTQLMNSLNQGDDSAISELESWSDNPFNPHLIGRMRVLPYMKNVIMKYIDNILQWADNLFSVNTLESINEANNLYMLASDLLGTKPYGVEVEIPDDANYVNLMNKLDEFGNAVINNTSCFLPSINQIGNLISYGGNSVSSLKGGYTHNSSHTSSYSSAPWGAFNSMFFFGIPRNDKLMEFWDVVADRLFKIRHNLDISGNRRSSDLFGTPIDPAILVKAVASGVNLGDALNSLNASVKPYRFEYILNKARSFTERVKSLGQSLLSALEKADGEKIIQMKNQFETVMSNEIKDLKEEAIKEAGNNINVLKENLKSANKRLVYYKKLASKGLNNYENKQLNNLKRAKSLHNSANRMGIISSCLSLFPTIEVGTSGGFLHATSGKGGPQLGSFVNIMTQALNAQASDYSEQANISGIKGSHSRRGEDWNQQIINTQGEIKALELQIQGAEIRLAMAKKELSNHKLSMENALQTEEFYKSKFTNQELYRWMVTQISYYYKQGYKLAYDLAKSAELSYKFEIGDDLASFITMNGWEGTRKGLMSGEKLDYDLSKMEAEYVTANERKNELTINVPLSVVAPECLLSLKSKGSSGIIKIPELYFDLYHTGGYNRRIKSVSLTIPAITGTYGNLGVKLSMSEGKVRKDWNSELSALMTNNYNTIIASNGINDSGMFELNFKDERYLPFEGNGAVEGNWNIDVLSPLTDFELSSISDVIITIKYTADHDSGNRITKDNLINFCKTLPVFISLASMEPGVLNTLKGGARDASFIFNKNHLAPFMRDVTVKPTSVNTAYTIKNGLLERFSLISVHYTKDESTIIITPDGIDVSDIDDIVFLVDLEEPTVIGI